MKKVILVIVIIISIIINLYTGFNLFIDNAVGKKTLLIDNQEEYIVKKIKENFNIDYEITKVTFWAGFPDGYLLDIYNGDTYKNVFSDNHETSEIYRYFQGMEKDKSKYEKYLIIEMVIELVVITGIIVFIPGRKNEFIPENR